MASVGISSRGGQLGVGGGGAATEIYYCFECDCTLTVVESSDFGVICPNCGGLVLEEFETPSSSPPPSSPPPRSTILIDPLDFFPTSDIDSDIELSDPLPPPPPPFLFEHTSYLRNPHSHPPVPPPPPPPPPPRQPPLRPLRRGNNRDSVFPFDGESGRLRPPSPSPPPPPPPSVLVLDGRPPCPQFPIPSASLMDYLFLSPQNDANQYSDFESEFHVLRPPLPPPLPPPPPPPREHFQQYPPLSPSSSTDNWENLDPPFTEAEEDSPSQHMTSFVQPPTPPSPSPPPRIQSPRNLAWDYFFSLSEPEENSPNQQWASTLQPPPPPPPWLQPPPMEGLLDMKMTEKLVSEWDCHQCAVCIDNFELNQMVKLLPCKHLYHSGCILRWLDLHKSCPVCRYKLPSS